MGAWEGPSSAGLGHLREDEQAPAQGTEDLRACSPQSVHEVCLLIRKTPRRIFVFGAEIMSDYYILLFIVLYLLLNWVKTL